MIIRVACFPRPPERPRAATFPKSCRPLLFNKMGGVPTLCDIGQGLSLLASQADPGQRALGQPRKPWAEKGPEGRGSGLGGW